MTMQATKAAQLPRATAEASSRAAARRARAERDGKAEREADDEGADLSFRHQSSKKIREIEMGRGESDMYFLVMVKKNAASVETPVETPSTRSRRRRTLTIGPRCRRSNHH